MISGWSDGVVEDWSDAAMKRRTVLGLIAGLVFLVMTAPFSVAQEKKNLRMVFVSLAWNSEIPFRD